jgi:hypothetical protein
MSDAKIEINLGGPLTLLTIVFVALKLANVIAWSWVWVFAPIWLPAFIILAIWLVILFFAIIANIFG